ncbi:uncharacterized protein LDX57_004888 [Aspergillus melleus]|uniref:uncharacterized protein n=1 Tax=Aspergillus melleus TaxID=138277 RepID=UPI001E8D7222|nr:Cytoplasmic tRNA 2-thiolation protein 2 [Aspergillus melleus]KAH8427173.1 Cytoplasmic tRNA 2-thiolation protein 2 [Aspergillus melleus]
MPGMELLDPCLDCREVESTLTLRKRRVCIDCYKRVVGYKVFRRTEKYRLRRDLPKTGEYKILVPLSYGLSSSVLLHLLHDQVRVQRSKSHPPPGFDLHVLIIDPSTISPSQPAHDEGFELAQKLFPLCTFTRIPFHDIFEHVPDMQQTMAQFAGTKFTDNPSLSHKERLDAFRSSIESATSKADVDGALRNRLIVAIAKEVGAKTILWGDSDTTLAAKTLANVAKGRGSSLTWQVSDGMSPSGLEFNFALRDLFTVELRNYASFFPELSRMILPDEPPSENTLTKNLSIDELMMRYVQTQGEKYPGVMLNVTRTANKLQSSQGPAQKSQCTFCGSSIWEAEDRPTSVEGQTPGFCYACARSRPDLSC